MNTLNWVCRICYKEIAPHDRWFTVNMGLAKNRAFHAQCWKKPFPKVRWEKKK